MKKVSIILPIYNGEKYLNRCIDSIINQTYKNIELICLNDGSTDKTLSILKSYNDKRIKIIDKKNSGVSDTRNIGIKNATGDYITFIDADDLYKENFIETMVNYIEKYNVDIVRCNYEVINERNRLIETGNLSTYCNQKYSKKEIENIIIPSALKGSIPCFCYLLLIKKDIIKNISFPTNIHMMEDVVFYMELLTTTKSLYICKDTLYTIMFNENSATNSNQNYERNIFNVIETNKIIKDIIKNKKLDNKTNITNININNLNAISDFIFKHYLYTNENTIILCKKLANNNDFINILNTTNLSLINFQKRKILQYIKNKSFTKLNIFFKLRKIVFVIRRLK